MTDLNAIYHSRHPIVVSLMRSAWLWAQDRSKDPRMKVGCVVYDAKSKASFYGYNGFNEGQPDYQHLWDNRDRDNPPTKHDFVRHAEANSIEKATRCIGDLSTCVLVCTHLPCPACMKDWIVPSKIRTVYYGETKHEFPLTRTQAVTHNIAIVNLPLQGFEKP